MNAIKTWGRKVLPLCLLVAMPAGLKAQADDPVIMTINGKDVLRSEFEYSYNKNNAEGVIDKKTVDEYVDLFVNYKLKVEAALALRLDTMKSYLDEFATYRDQQVRPTLINDDDVEAEAWRIYKQTQTFVDSLGGQFHASHILCMARQQAPQAEQEAARLRADSLYQALRAGADFAELAKAHSDDKGSAVRGGDLGWAQPRQFVKEFEDAVFALKPGELSQPVKSPFGYHIILLQERRNFEPYDSVHDDIRRFIDARGIREHIIDQKIDSLAGQEGITPAQLLERCASDLSDRDVEMRNLIREYHDGLLLFEISNRHVWEKAAKDEAGLAAYFKAHKKDYAWDEPRYKGMAYHVKEQKDVKAVRNSVKGLPFDQWADKLRTTFNNDSIIRIRVEKGLFKKGDNALIDRMVFKCDTVAKPVEGYPIDAVFGKVLKKGPEDYTDVRGLVTADYQDLLEKQWVAELRQRYKFSVDKDVLATVNKH